MRSFSKGTHWVCAVDVMYPFQANLEVPPALGVVMAKRFWSGQISINEIIEVCDRYDPEQILLRNGKISTEWQTFLQPRYKLALATDEFALYVKRQF